MTSTEPHRFTVASHLCTAVWTFTNGVSGPEAARRYYSEVNRVPVDSVSIGVRAEVTR